MIDFIFSVCGRMNKWEEFFINQKFLCLIYFLFVFIFVTAFDIRFEYSCHILKAKLPLATDKKYPLLMCI